MAVAPWFKFFAADFLMDADVDALPLEAQAILVRMWAVCWMEGELPSEPAQIARKCRVPQEALQTHHKAVEVFFATTKTGTLISERMERERGKSSLISVIRKKVANLRQRNTDGTFVDGSVDVTKATKPPRKTPHSEFRVQSSDKTIKPSCADAQACKTDPRWHEFIEDWKKYFEHKTGKPFGPKAADFAVYKQFLEDNPSVTRDIWRSCLNNRAKSPISHSKPARFWIGRMLEYEQGPLDKFWEPILMAGANGNGQVRTKAERRNADISETTAAVFGINRQPDGNTAKGLPDKTSG